MTITINNATDGFFVALQKLVSEWKGVEIQKTEKTSSDIQKKLDTAHRLFGAATENEAAFIRENRMNFGDRNLFKEI